MTDFESGREKKHNRGCVLSAVEEMKTTLQIFSYTDVIVLSLVQISAKIFHDALNMQLRAIT